MSGQRLDSHQTHYDTLDQLEDYCYRVAGSVGEMLLPVLHTDPDDGIVEAGIWLGKAMQIVNIVRDVGEDQRLGRRYIPLELMESRGYTQEEFAAGMINEALRGLIGDLAGIAGEWFRRGLLHLSTYPPESAFSIRLAAGYYGAILKAVEENEYDVFTKRAYVDDEGRKDILRRVLMDMAASERRLATGRSRCRRTANRFIRKSRKGSRNEQISARTGDALPEWGGDFLVSEPRGKGACPRQVLRACR